MARSEKNLVAVFTDTANAIRGKLESQEQISPLDFADQINSIPVPSGTLEITEHGVNDVTNYALVDVNVPGYPEPEGTEYIYANGQYNIKDYEFVEVNLDVPESDGAYIIYNGNWVYPEEMPTGKYYKFTGSTFDPMEYSDGSFYWIYNDNLYYNNALNSGGAICYIEDINNGIVVDTGADTY